MEGDGFESRELAGARPPLFSGASSADVDLDRSELCYGDSSQFSGRRRWTSGCEDVVIEKDGSIFPQIPIKLLVGARRGLLMSIHIVLRDLPRE